MLEEWSYENEWFEEGNVSRRIKELLENTGYMIVKFNLDKRARGHDIEAVKNDEKLIVEVKGFPSDKYVGGKKKGQPKPTHPNLQAKHWFSQALFALIVAKSQNPSVKIALGLPDSRKYGEFINKIEYVKEKLGLFSYLVDENGNVRIVSPSSKY